MKDPDAEAGRDLAQSFEAWAAVSARLLDRPAPEAKAILDELGIASSWPQADAKWSKRIAEDISNGALARVERYGDICAAELSRRHEAGERSEGPPASGATPAPATPVHGTPASANQTPAFAQQLMPAGPAPQTPGPEQDRTAAVDLDAARQALVATAQATEWPVERYARYCAEVHAFPEKSGEIHQRYGLTEPEIRAHVNEAWRERLAQDRVLYERWAKLVSIAQTEFQDR